jgi:hypothetical protein
VSQAAKRIAEVSCDTQLRALYGEEPIYMFRPQ